ncbi:hypothetical protein [Glutamicibacter sp. Je.9.36]|uniref:hypothetical protein n=1 Tax=Glutamicibacter sp. Je.9.36 TaxID=3142837 RepID=UPI003DA7EE51
MSAPDPAPKKIKKRRKNIQRSLEESIAQFLATRAELSDEAHRQIAKILYRDRARTGMYFEVLMMPRTIPRLIEQPRAKKTA